MDDRLKDRVAVITGGSSGIGRATAWRFAKSGARVVIADLVSSGVEKQIDARHGAKTAIFVKTDVTDETQIKNLVAEAAAFGHGRIDILVTSAGTSTEGKYDPPKDMHDFPTEDFDKLFAINVRGLWLCCKYVVAHMLKQEPLPANARGERTRGKIVNVASIFGKKHNQGLTAAPQFPAYVPTKHAVIGMTKQMAANYAKDRIHANCLCPGFTKTPLIQKMLDDPCVGGPIIARHPWGALGEPEDIADAVLFLCGDESKWVTGHAMVVDGGYTTI